MFHQVYSGPRFNPQVRFGTPSRSPMIPHHHGFIPHPAMTGHPARYGSPQRLISMGSPLRSPPRSPGPRLLSPQRTASPLQLRFGSPSRMVQLQPQNMVRSLLHAGSRVQMPQGLMSSATRVVVASPPRLVHSPQRIIGSPSRIIHHQLTTHSLAMSTIHQPQIQIPQAQGYAIPLQPFIQSPPQMIYPAQAQMVFHQPLVPKFSPSKVSTAKFNTRPNNSSSNQKLKSSDPKQDHKSDRDDLDKRFNEALDRTKKIVEKFQKQDRMTPSKNLESIYEKMPESVQERVEEEENDGDGQPLQEIALQYEDGYIYKGQGILPQQRKGFGVLVDSQENEVYAGFWDNNVYNGEGRLNNLVLEPLKGPINWKDMTTISNGWQSYQGEFKDGRMEGKGVLKLSNGEYYQGQFLSGMIHGVGTFSTLEGQNIRGSWSHGIFQEYN